MRCSSPGENSLMPVSPANVLYPCPSPAPRRPAAAEIATAARPAATAAAITRPSPTPTAIVAGHDDGTTAAPAPPGDRLRLVVDRLDDGEKDEQDDANPEDDEDDRPGVE